MKDLLSVFVSIVLLSSSCSFCSSSYYLVTSISISLACSPLPFQKTLLYYALALAYSLLYVWTLL
ncbi:hypothetical protein BDF14DRAFT_1799089 [Spinellus fusiger]|nr:hypothetical protein BDF14DRAFT_1799089 [Spinellus fusiger]